MDHLELKEVYKNTFNTVADGYGNSAMRFFSESANRVPSYLSLKGNEHVLDVATGTGYVALAIAKELPEGKVTGIDFSKGMLNQAIRRKSDEGIRNVSFIEMDMQLIEFPDEYFDIATNAFSIFFAENMKEQLVHIINKVKVGGTVITTTFFDNAFAPLVNLFLGRLENYGIEVPPLSWKRVATKEKCTSLFEEAGLYNIKCAQKESGYYLKDASDWWYIIWNGGFRGLVNKLSQSDFEKFKEEHLIEVNELASSKGIWLELNILYTIGTKKA